MEKVKTCCLELGDKIKFHNDEYGWGTVVLIKEHDIIEVVRPYIHTGDTILSGPRLLNYVGIETVKLCADSTMEFDTIRNQRKWK